MLLPHSDQLEARRAFTPFAVAQNLGMARRTHGLDHLEDALAHPRLAALGLKVRGSAPDEGFGVAIRAVLPPTAPFDGLPKRVVGV